MEKWTEFDNYQEITQLGKGGVWLVLDRESRKVFVKKYRRDFSLQVYESISRIQDPHIPRIFRCMETDGVLCIIEEYIAGETLLEKMENGYIFSEQEILNIMVQLCEALECLHIRFKPIIHRDIKPSNVMISNDGVVKLIDYNAARRYEKGAAQDTSYIGTPGYAAPEQYGFSQSDARTDIYAMGVLLNYMLTGQYPNEKTARGELGKIARKCIQMDPDQRYDSVSSLKWELQRWVREEKERKEPLSLWPVPGFRTKKAWKMIAAVCGYLMIGRAAFLVAGGAMDRYGQNKLFFGVLEFIWIAVFGLFCVAMLTDYGGIARQLPLVKSKNLVVRWIGYFLWGVLEFGGTAGILVMIELVVNR